MPPRFALTTPSLLRWLGLVGAALFVVFAVWGTTVTDAFLSDDNRIVAEVQADGPFARWTGPPDVFFRPLVSLLFALDLAIYGLDPRGFHITNLLLHVGVGLWVVALGSILARRAGIPRASHRGLGLLAGAIFWIHPSHSEAVAWISGRGDLLVAFFALASVVTYLHWRDKTEHPTTHAPRGRVFRGLSVLFLLAALASKEAAVAVPLVLVALEVFTRPRSAQRFVSRLGNAVRHASWHLAALPLYLVVRALIIGQMIGGYGSEAHMKLDPLLLGNHLLAFLSRATLPRLGGHQIHNLVFVALVVALLVAVFATQRRHAGTSTNKPQPAFGALTLASLVAFVLSVLPTLSMQISRTSSASERLIYLPSAYIAVATAALVFLLLRHRIHRSIVGGLVVVFLAVACLRSNPSWRASARAANNVVDAVLAIDTADTIYILTLPASIDGAYVLHNNFRSALALRSPRRQTGWHAPIQVRLPSLEAPVEVKRLKASVFEVATSEANVQFHVREHPLMRVSHRRPQSLRVGIPSLGVGDWVVAWSDGEMVTLKHGSTRPPSTPG